ncbi:MAG: polymer-forming cytoskeletal protein [Aestuariivita sp.]|nr:polymer-forming cytoskeletal protein [Aestuariivita sp.]MCY4201046.1 polymer-forming cytoskeletal protein [Aestuariivita sp.]MCY4288454.1 polymer-forming cytoskeletal protein [Aestuariivita sp.]MCY4347621.1 polymer-forming cytoskeletal protein [Aestuariivita sp.]
MFSKTRTNEPRHEAGASPSQMAGSTTTTPATTQSISQTAPKPKPPASTLSSDLHFTGDLVSTGDIQIEGKIEGDVRGHQLTVGENAIIKGEIIGDDVVINGRITGSVRGLKVRLSSTAKVEGDIIHKIIAIESGAQFDGSVTRQDDPLNSGKQQNRQPPKVATPIRQTAPPSPGKPGVVTNPVKQEASSSE